MALQDVEKAIAAEAARQAAETAAQKATEAKTQAEKDKAAAAAAKTDAQKKALADLKKKQAQYQEIITKLAKGGIDDRSAAVLKGQAVGLSNDIADLQKKLPQTTTQAPVESAAKTTTTAAKTTTTPTPTVSTAPELTPTITSVTDTKPASSDLRTTLPTPSATPTATGMASAGMGAVGRGEYGTLGPTGTYMAPAVPTDTIDKRSTAVAKAIELYQMPDIIFSNVPELQDILNKYLDTKAPITLDQFVKEVGNSNWYRQNSRTIQNRLLQQFNYNDLIKNNKDASNTQYAQDIKKITESVISKARELGAPIDQTSAELIAGDLYIHNMETDMTALTKRLAGSIRTQPLGVGGTTGYLGAAEANYQKLLQLAKDNGLDLKTILPTRVSGATPEQTTNNVLAGLADGSLDISAIEQTARTLASQGQPQYVKDLLAQGYDLAAIYAPYKKLMASTLELSPDQINLNDPTLRSAITNTGDMNTYDFQKALRKDPRWQYTQNARQDVSNAALGVLRDFGFQG